MRLGGHWRRAIGEELCWNLLGEHKYIQKVIITTMYITNGNGKEHDEIERLKLKNLESGKTIFKVKFLNGEN